MVAERPNEPPPDVPSIQADITTRDVVSLIRGQRRRIRGQRQRNR